MKMIENLNGWYSVAKLWRSARGVGRNASQTAVTHFSGGLYNAGYELIVQRLCDCCLCGVSKEHARVGQLSLRPAISTDIFIYTNNLT